MWVENTPMPTPQSSPAEGQTEHVHTIESGTYAFLIGNRDNVWLCGSFTADA